MRGNPDYCPDDPICQAEKAKYWVEYQAHYDKKLQPRLKEERKKPRKKKKKNKSGRKCRNCGKDPWPNYFFCPGCHEDVSRSMGHEVIYL